MLLGLNEVLRRLPSVPYLTQHKVSALIVVSIVVDS